MISMNEDSGTDKFFHLNVEVRGLLEHSYRLHPQIPDELKWTSNPRIQLWDEGGGWDTPASTLTVYEPWTPETETRRIVREAVWDSDGDLKSVYKHEYVSPTIIVRDAYVSSDKYKLFMEQLSQCSISFMSNSGEGRVDDDVDVEGFAYFSADDPAAAIRLSWGLEFPDDWQGVIEIASELKSYLRSLLESQGE